jgi:hypothetical protein
VNDEPFVDQDVEQILTNNQLRGYYVAAVGASLAAWTLMFNYGVYDTIFFRTLFGVWAACVAVFVATLLLPEAERPLRGETLYALLGPTLWLLAEVLGPVAGETLGRWYAWIDTLLVTLTIASLPYVGYVLLVILQGEAFRLPTRMFVGLVVIVVIVGALGYGLGRYHYLFLSCQQFAVAGEFIPPNCLELDLGE